MYFQQLTKDEWDGLAYVDMGLDGFAVEPPEGVTWSDEERKKKATSYLLNERRRTRTHVASSYIDGDLKAKHVTLTTQRGESVDVLIVGSTDDINKIPQDWKVEIDRLTMGTNYDNVYGWMTLKNEAPLLLIRASDEKAVERLEAFLADAIRFIKRERESEAA